MPGDTYRVIDNETVLLTLDNVGHKGYQHYQCRSDKTRTEIRLYVGSKWNKILYFKGVLHPIQKLACFVLYLKIIDIFLKNDVRIL